ncbi:hypothetical protein PAAG_12186 [Paracoccidioides lutzii Pb01]|uniref:Protein kinase domain-containing protein n=1 Tax=Paracoccidioides lutzii (strain ATCC MYA-826 / Pb01) TaxID=502779 RepID=A0A0A2V0Y7_PARBA|nr:hypothetical protein PAAG_12186 [Paracoccidioides lutzii Pb01]KGQ01148.1 hypothetical protein PAAG_12186 [Paracoccidioides lutzii Pb01]
MQAASCKWKARAFSEDILRAMPKYIPSIKSPAETANVRSGKDGAVGMSAPVMLVRDRTTGNIFGSKEPFSRASGGHATARARVEASLQAEYTHIVKLDHPHIVKAFDLVLDEDITLSPGLIIEYIPQNLSETDIKEADVLRVLTHLCTVLGHMHTIGITHRDVKPDNVLVQKR